ncbi:cation:proton antiporter [Methylomarinum sp. Ch1-1]|uniref:Cation:proton antiporter n=1 Tax=Methylomarinum roseum TaxID=3067653 RepID=A0AAU7NTW3_9GAMM|nr:cation:proton antiporter [Methylomarinum sp. Ch1-1]MDP4519502.1 cation:proton antiporter [Methylomarinum sp. Ch1-1]
MPGHLMELSEILLVAFSLLFLAMVTAGLSRHLTVPYTVMLVILGMAINLAKSYIPFFPLLKNFHITSELVLFVFLPALIFEASLKIDARELLKNIWPVLLLAIPGMLISMLLVGIGLWFTLDVDIAVALLFGALISATDPVAVVAIFKNLGISKRLTVLVEGESLFNDATAIVLFNMILAMVLTPQFSYSNALPAIPEFFRVFLGGIGVGVVVALLMSELMVRLNHEDSSAPVVFSLIMPYFCFIFAEHAFEVSGVMAVLSAAICLNVAGLMRLSGETSDAVYTTWEVLVLICNSLLFLLIGMSIDIVVLAQYWQPIAFAVIAVTVARGIGVYGFLPMTIKLFRLPRVDVSSQHMMWWGGLRGGLAIAIVLTVPDTLAEKRLLFELTLGVVLVSLLINASTIRYLIRWRRIDGLAEGEKAELQQNLERVNNAVDAVLQQFSQMHLLDKELKLSIEHEMEQDLQSHSQDLNRSQRLELVRINAIDAEKDELELLQDIGLLNYYTYLTFRDLLHHDQARSSQQPKKRNDNLAEAKNIFVRSEWRIINFLGQHDWTQSLLTKYQELRFSNRLQHDIAGVLLAHAALRLLKEQEHFLDPYQYHRLRNVYQDRLRRRQLRLRTFAEHYSDFYHQYENVLFQRVALKYSLKLINDEHEEGKISTKVYNHIGKRLHVALKKLPMMKTALSLNRRDDWINHVSLFKGLPEQELEKLAGNAQYVNFLSGDTIFNEGDKGHAIYILVGGRLNVFKLNQHGQNQHLAELREGCVVGEHALFEESRRSATVVAKTYATLLRLTIKDITQLSKVLPELQSRLLAIDRERIENTTGK